MNMDRLPTPEQPQWEPKFKGDTGPTGKHELPAVLRMQRNGWPGPKIAEHFKYPAAGLRLMRELEAALTDETDAAACGEQICAGTWLKGVK